MNKEIKDVILINRKKQNLTQEEFASRLNISNKVVSNWETGRSYPDVLLLPEIAKVLDIDINNLFYNKEDNAIKLDNKDYSDELRRYKGSFILAYLFLMLTSIVYFGMFFTRFIFYFTVIIATLFLAISVVLYV